MARSMTPQWQSDDFPTGELCIEGIISRVFHAPGVSTTVASTRDQFKGVTALLDLSADAGSHAVVRSLRAALPSARTSHRVFEAKGIAAMLDWCGDAPAFDIANVVLRIDHRSEMSLSAMKEVVDHLTDVRFAKHGRIFVVSDHPGRWRSLAGVSSYVRSVRGADASCAALLYLLLASDMAPDTLACLDLDDAGFVSVELCPVPRRSLSRCAGFTAVVVQRARKCRRARGSGVALRVVGA